MMKLWSVFNILLLTVCLLSLDSPGAVLGLGSAANADELTELFKSAEKQLRSESLRARKMLQLSQRSSFSSFHSGFHGMLGSPHASSGLQFTKMTPESALIHRSFMLALRVQEMLRDGKNQTNGPIMLRAPPQFCPFSNNMDCDASAKFRSIDGSCNNLASPLLGKSSTPFKRYMKTFYQDKINQPRRLSTRGRRELPNPRSISLQVHDPLEVASPSITNYGVMFGQFVDHDFALSASSSDGAGGALKCMCGSFNSDCINVPMPDDDTVDSDQVCMTLTRSGASFDKFDCTLNAREQLNLQTHFLDLSQIYGSDASSSNALRTFSRGLLRSSRIPGQPSEYLPFASPGICVEETSDQLCFSSGDDRTSQNLLLVSIHTVWMREHNRIARQLARINRQWDDDRIFNEARRITIAEYQNAIYAEWLPVLLSDDTMKSNDLNVLDSNSNYTFSYDNNANPNLAGEFATAAYRFGHSLVRSFIRKFDQNLNEIGNLTLTSIFLRPTEAYTNGGLEAIMRGLLVDPGTAFDPHVTDEIQNHLFENPGSPQTRRFSISTINIARGRDHGIAPYNEFRVFSGLKKASTFDDLIEVAPVLRDKLKSIYSNVNDIDAFTGGTSETPVDGGLLGPTFSVIVANQFKDLKTGDRFYFEHGDNAVTRLSLPQLNEIRRQTMSTIICSNLRLKSIQRNAFRQVSDQNPMVDCKDLPKLNVNLWQE